MEIQNIVICAGGKQKRFQEMAIFPKVLLPADKSDSILSYDCKLFKHYKVTLIINDDYGDMVDAYIRNLNLNVNLVRSHCATGSANTILAVKDQLPKSNVMFLWSDLVLDRSALEDMLYEVKDIDSKIIFGTYGLEYRLGVNDDGTMNNDKHNIPGIFFIEDLEYALAGYSEIPDFDFAQVLMMKDSKAVVEYKGYLKEFVDKQKFLEYYRNQGGSNTLTPRFFNQISVDGGLVVKKCIDKNYYRLIAREAYWYREVQVRGIEGVTPRLYDYNDEMKFMKMDFIPGECVYKALNYDNYHDVFDSIKSQLEKLHSVEQEVGDKVLLRDAKLEFYTKPIERCQKIAPMLVSYDEKDLTETIQQAWDIIEENIKGETYSLTHGDLNMSNMLWTGEEVKFIDPRGYFGQTECFGLREYDYAKILYALTGFDKFNADPFIYYSKGVFDMPKDMSSLAPSWLNKPLYKIMVGTIWVSLTSYIGQDVYKSNISYEYGMDYLKKATAEYMKEKCNG